jgi:hypothetical protein
VPLPDEVLFKASAEAKPTTLTLATDVLRFPPVVGRGPVSESESVIPSALAFRATASPLKVVVAWAKQTTGLKAKIAVRQAAMMEFFLVFIQVFSFIPDKVQFADTYPIVCESNRLGG